MDLLHEIRETSNTAKRDAMLAANQSAFAAALAGAAEPGLGAGSRMIPATELQNLDLVTIYLDCTNPNGPAPYSYLTYLDAVLVDVFIPDPVDGSATATSPATTGLGRFVLADNVTAVPTIVELYEDVEHATIPFAITTKGGAPAIYIPVGSLVINGEDWSQDITGLTKFVDQVEPNWYPYSGSNDWLALYSFAGVERVGTGYGHIVAVACEPIESQTAVIACKISNGTQPLMYGKQVFDLVRPDSGTYGTSYKSIAAQGTSQGITSAEADHTIELHGFKEALQNLEDLDGTGPNYTYKMAVRQANKVDTDVELRWADIPAGGEGGPYPFKVTDNGGGSVSVQGGSWTRNGITVTLADTTLTGVGANDYFYINLRNQNPIDASLYPEMLDVTFSPSFSDSSDTLGTSYGYNYVYLLGKFTAGVWTQYWKGGHIDDIVLRPDGDAFDTATARSTIVRNPETSANKGELQVGDVHLVRASSLSLPFFSSNDSTVKQGAISWAALDGHEGTSPTHSSLEIIGTATGSAYAQLVGFRTPVDSSNPFDDSASTVHHFAVREDLGAGSVNLRWYNSDMMKTAIDSEIQAQIGLIDWNTEIDWSSVGWTTIFGTYWETWYDDPLQTRKFWEQGETETINFGSAIGSAVGVKVIGLTAQTLENGNSIAGWFANCDFLPTTDDTHKLGDRGTDVYWLEGAITSLYICDLYAKNTSYIDLCCDIQSSGNKSIGVPSGPVGAVQIINGGGVIIGGNKVLGDRQFSISDATGGSFIDVEARAAINGLLVALRPTGHGLIAT
jgi:hypothetical protein